MPGTDEAARLRAINADLVAALEKTAQWVEHFQRHFGADEIAPDGPAMGAVRDARAVIARASTS